MKPLEIVGRQTVALDKMLDERIDLPVKKPIDQVVYDVRNDFLRADSRPINIVSAHFFRREITLALQAPEIGLDGPKIQIAVLRQCFMNFPNGGTASEVPYDSSDFQFRFGKTG